MFGRGSQSASLEVAQSTSHASRKSSGRSRSASTHVTEETPAQEFGTDWGALPPELLRDVLTRVKKGDEQWPARRNVVAAAGVCRAWRSIIRDSMAAQNLDPAEMMTFPCHLKQSPAPNGAVVECYIVRNRKTGVYSLYMGAPPSTPGERAGKLLLAAKKIGWRLYRSEYVISLNPRIFLRSGNAYAGRLRANFLSTKFSIFDPEQQMYLTQVGNESSKTHPLPVSAPPPGAVASAPTSPSKSSTASVPPVPAAVVVYALNALGTRGPRRIQCTLFQPPRVSQFNCGVTCAAVQGELMSTNVGESMEALEQVLPAQPQSTSSMPPFPSCGDKSAGLGVDYRGCAARQWDCACTVPREPIVLKNKPPRWHDQLQCWCLNFRGRVTVASVKNFQLVDGNGPGDADKAVLMQFGKMGKDVFTMDYSYPLSAFQAFAICLSSFDTRVACE